MNTEHLFLKEHFPLLNNYPNLAYFDNASSTQIHQSVLDRMNQYYTNFRSNPGRSEYRIAIKAANALQVARDQVAEFLDVSSDTIMFTSGSTQALNWVSNWHQQAPKVAITNFEHNSNIVPWLAQDRSVLNNKLVILDLEQDGRIDYSKAKKRLSECRNGVLSITTTSNLTGIDVKWNMLAQLAKSYDMAVCLDMSQGYIQCLDPDTRSFIKKYVDYVTFSGHKMFGPNGVGVLYAKMAKNLNPMYGGGGMVDHVTYEGYTITDAKHKHQAGTANVAGIIGMGVACELLSYNGSYKKQTDIISKWLSDLGLFKIPEIQLLGKQKISGNIYSFKSNLFDMTDLALLLSQEDIAVRTGQMCAYPYAQELVGDRSILRISTAPYNTRADCEKLVIGLKNSIQKLMSKEK